MSTSGKVYKSWCKCVCFQQGMILLTLSVSVISTHHREAVFFVALYVLAVGEGGHKPCVQTFAADQFDEDYPEGKAAKSSFFNWWYLGIVFGATAATFVVIYVQVCTGFFIWHFFVLLILVILKIEVTDLLVHKERWLTYY